MNNKEFGKKMREVLAEYNEYLVSKGHIMHVQIEDNSLFEKLETEEFLAPYLESGRNVLLFDSFWELYPRKVAKKKAEAKFYRMPLYQQEQAIDNIPKYKLWADINSYSYTHPTTYLNQERFADEEICNLPTQDDIIKIMDAARESLNLKSSSVKPTKHLLLEVARCVWRHEATIEDVKIIGKWMVEVWGRSEVHAVYINMDQLFHSSRFVERRAKARIYADK